MIGSILGWMMFGMIAGGLARLIHPGNDAMGWVSTILLGITGSLLGGGLAYILKLGMTPYQPGGWIMAIVGSIILLSMGYFSTRPRLTN